MSDHLHAEEDQTLLLPDGRTLGYLRIGEGTPVFYFHGLLIGSRLDVLNMKEVAAHLKLQIIGVDRPGVGLSTFTENRRLCDFAADIRFLANHSQLEKFAIVGVVKVLFVSVWVLVVPTTAPVAPWISLSASCVFRSATICVAFTSSLSTIALLTVSPPGTLFIDWGLV